ncbi:MAG: SDR family NAD(P)-dependent oxidoreductase, partial [bacterium]|nr:SDR family NAD(P)-dependent oxidoreductase [bacterium]
DLSFVAVGTPVYKCQLIIVDDNGAALEDDLVGHILIKGDNVTSGYYNNEEATSGAITPEGWLKTGDLGFQRNGNLYITGRAKDIIFVNGQNYYAHDIERVAEELEGIGFERIMVCDAFDSQRKANEAIAFVVFKREIKNFLALANNLRQHIVEKAGLEIDKIIPVKKIPKTTSGKIQRYKLKERYQNGMYAGILQEIEALNKKLGAGKRKIPLREMKEQIARIWKEILNIKQIEYNANFFDLGGNSSYALRVKSKLEELYVCKLEDVALFKYPTISTLAHHLSGEEKETADSLRESRLKRKKQKFDSPHSGKGNGVAGMEIAVIGMAGRFPGAKNIEQFWGNLKNGIESISFFSDEELLESGLEARLLREPNYIKAKGIIEDVECFDSSFFGYTPVEAEMMDPQMRMFHHCIWEALEDAGHVPGSYDGLIGVYAGATPNHYWVTRAFLAGNREDSEVFIQTQLSEKDFMTTRVSYKLNLTGPSFTMYTACSTSLVAIDLACQGLLTGKCDIALAGGVSISLPQKSGYLYREEMLFSRDGHNRSFDADASGTVFSDGAGIVVLKPLSEALRDRDNIYAVIKGSAINNDGNRKVGYTAPSLEGQAEVIIDAQLIAGVEPESIRYIEAHGSGTILGDPIEVAALKTAFNAAKTKFCGIGSVKANIGHLNAAAGIAGFIKTVLVLKHRVIPPTLHFKTPNPKIDFENSPFYVVTEEKEWKREIHPLRAGVSSQGIGGTNAHVILEEAPPLESTSESRNWKLLLLSARTESSLNHAAANLLDFLKNNPGVNLADAAYTLQNGRKAFKHRRMLVCTDSREAIEILSAGDPAKIHSSSSQSEDRPVVFMFAGLGAQYVNMGRDLYREEALFREEINRCFAILKPLVGEDVKNCLYPSDSIDREEAKEKLNQTDKSQLAIFVFEYALTRLLMHWGIKPAAMIGYSFGEYVAACIAGVFSLEDALKLIVFRGQLIGGTYPGMMLSVPVTRQELEPLLENQEQISLAVDNGPSSIISGPEKVITEFEQRQKTKKYLCMRLQTRHAIHSPLMEPILKEFEKKVGQMTLNEPSIPYISNFTGTWITVKEATSPSYWSNHLRHTVQFAAGMKELTKEPDCLFMEIGPGRDLAALSIRYMGSESNHKVLNLVRPPHGKVSDLYYLLNKLARLWIYGKKIDWTGFYAGEKRRFISMPTYAFAAERYPIEGISQKGSMLQRPSNAGKIKDISQWFYIPSWKLSGLSESEITKQHNAKWLIFADNYGLGRQLEKQLETDGHLVVMVKPGVAFQKMSEREFAVSPDSSADYLSLFKELEAMSLLPQNILHLWLITNEEVEIPLLNRAENAQQLGFYSMLFLTRALGDLGITDDIRILTVVNNVFQLAGERLLNPEKATVLGTCKVIPQEYPNIDCRCADIRLPGIESREEKKLLLQLLQEFQSKSNDMVVAYRNYQRWVQVFEPHPFEPPRKETPRLRERGVYLITGGLGGIGLVLAQHLAKTVKARLVLTGRSAFPAKEDWGKWLTNHDMHDSTSRKIKKLQEIEALGSDVLVFSADISDLEGMQDIIVRSKKIFGPINGLFHAAGVLKDGLSQLKTREMVEPVFSPKIKGTMVIEESLKNCDPDFFILFSSLSSILGPGGQVSYCAANAFLDAFALHKMTKDGTFTTAINWDIWQEVGMAAASSLQNETLKDGILPKEGLDALTRIMGESFPQVVVASRDLKFLLKKRENTTAGGIGEEDGRSPSSKQLHKRPQLGTPYVAYRDETEKKLAEIWQNFFGYERIGIHDDFFELGGDSLQATSILTKIHKEMNVLIPITEFFERKPTIEQFSQYIAGKANAGNHIYSAIEKTEVKKYYPLSKAQKGIYSIQQMDLENIAYNESAVMEILGEPEIKKIENTFKNLIKRHESFRFSFKIVDTELVIEIHDEVACKIDYYENGNEDTDVLIKRYITPFDLTQAPLLRVGLIKIDKSKYLLILSFHHIIADGLSTTVIQQDFCRLYGGEDLSPLKIQYKDYAAWQKEFLKSEAILKQEKYWLDRFQGLIPVLNFPTDYPRPELQSFSGKNVDFHIHEKLTAKIKEIAAGGGLTLYMVLIAFYYILLSKYTGREDIIIGTPVAGRNHHQLSDQVGMYVNVLLMRNYPAPGITVKEFLTELSHNTINAFENQDYRFDDLVENLDIKRDRSRNPIYDVVFAMQIFKSSDFEIPHLKTSLYNYDRGTCKTDLRLAADETDGKIKMRLTYATALFKNETAKSMAKHYVDIIKQAVEDTTIKIQDIEIAHHLVTAKPAALRDVADDFDF